jgi:hypothetical protein
MEIPCQKYTDLSLYQGSIIIAHGPNLLVTGSRKHSFIGTQPCLFIDISSKAVCKLTAKMTASTKTTWPVKPKIFTVWPYAENVC